MRRQFDSWYVAAHRTPSRAVVALAIAAFAAGCDDPVGPERAGAPTNVRVLERDVAVGVGDTVRLGAAAYDAQERVVLGTALQWRSIDPTRVGVDASSGLAIARDTGTARVIVAAGALEDTVAVIVTRRVASLELVLAADSILSGAGVAATVIARDANGIVIIGAPLVWTSSDSTIVKVSRTGAVRGHGEGTATVRVSAGVAVAERAVRTVYQHLSFGGMRPAQLSIGTVHGCALDDARRAYCWGSGASGRTGRGVSGGTQVLGPVAGDNVFASVQARDVSTCGLTAAGRLLCWGAQSIAPRNSNVPVPILDSIPSQGFAVGGHNQACALARDGVLRCWGHNDFYQLGRGPIAGYDTLPLPVTGDARFRAADVNRFAGCGITTDDRTMCWGSVMMTTSGETLDRPTEVPGAPPLRQVAVVGDFAYDGTGCGLTSAGEAWCWGADYLGVVPRPRWYSTTALRAPTSRTFVQLDRGAYHFCALTADGEIWCWGWPDAYGAGWLDFDVAPPQRFAPTRRFRLMAAYATGVCGITFSEETVCSGVAPAPATGL